MAGRTGSWSPAQIYLLVASFALMFVEGYDVQVLSYAAPLILSDWKVSHAAFGPVFGAGLFGYMIGATLLTGVADRIGRKPVIVLGALTFGALTFTTVWAADIREMLVLRFIAGLGLGVAIPTTMALNSEFAPLRVRSVWLTTLAVGYALGGSLGGVLVAPAMAKWGWHAAFVAGGVAPVIVAVFLAALLPESVDFLRARGASAGRVDKLIARYRLSLGSAGEAAANGAARGLPVVQLFTEGRALLTLLVWGAFVTSLLGHHFLTSWVPTIMEQKGIPFQRAVFIGSLLLGGSVVGGPIIGALADRYGGRVLAAAYLLSVPFVAAIGASALPDPLLPVVVFLAGATLVGGQIGITALVATLYPMGVRSSGAGWALGVGRLGAIFGPMVGGVLLSAKVPLSTVFLLAALPGLLCAFILLAIFGRRSAPAQH